MKKPALLRLSFLLLVIVAGVFGVSRLDFDVDPLSLLPQGLPGLQGTRLLREQKRNLLIISVQAEDPSLVEVTAEALAEHLSTRPELCASVRSKSLLQSDPAIIAEVVAYLWLNAPPEEVQKLIASLDPASIAALLAKSKEAAGSSLDLQNATLAGYDPLGLARGALGLMNTSGGDMSSLMGDEFSSADGTLRLLFVTPPGQALADYRAANAWLTQIKTEVREKWLPQQGELKGVKIGFTGDPAFQAEIATGMEGDMRQSIGAVTFIVGFLFWLLHRSVKPLLWLMLAILCANLITLGTAGAIYGSLNVMSMGFAAILTGLIEDFGVVGLHVAREHPGEGFGRICRRALPSVAWSAISIAGIFAMLGLSQLPGVAQLGILSALGVLIGAAVMIFGFLPLGMKAGKLEEHHGSVRVALKMQGVMVGVVLAALVASTVVIGWKGLPRMDFGSAVLRPEKSEAFDVFEAVEQRMLNSSSEPGRNMPLVFAAKDASTLRQSIVATQKALKSQEVEAHLLPLALVPDAEAQKANLSALQSLTTREELLKQAIDAAGFTEVAFALTQRVLGQWREWAAAKPALPLWPKPVVLENLGDIVSQHVEHGMMAVGSVRLAQGRTLETAPVLHAVEKIPGAHAAGWAFLRTSLEPLLKKEILRVCVPTVVIACVLFLLVFHGWRERVFALLTLTASGWILLGGMSAWSLTWNLMSVGAVPLCLGLGLDFTIHVMHSLREPGMSRERIASLGRSLAYCGLSTGLAFGALAVGSNRGLITLGMTAMIGVLTVLVTAAFALPWVWYRRKG
ncbi:MMPL family transporter [Prosthecobacter vanneervenii]|uniref:Putative RND superfamily exporter protein n=1 Tax=Prosthecobacter vanneervenii TaxID=48466 RepID=A0A7W8DM13_9BACT|nr:MMPL family transporter [Prosthecobacter vanneervenii]MBB5034610.1 putative RND superfamily exporter protein [Prosthecobacter vanneervenii]